MKKLLVLIIGAVLILPSFLFISCSCQDSDVINEKASSQLIAQVNLRIDQMADPTAERLEVMRNMGMQLVNLGQQRIFIYLNQEPDASQTNEIEQMNIVLYLDSWIPPVGSHTTGYLLADMPVDVLEELAGKEYIIRLDTAEHILEPHFNN